MSPKCWRARIFATRRSASVRSYRHRCARPPDSQLKNIQAQRADRPSDIGTSDRPDPLQNISTVQWILDRDLDLPEAGRGTRVRVRIEGEGRWDYAMRSIGMRDAKDHSLPQRLGRMSTVQQSTPSPRLWRALVWRVVVAASFAGGVFVRSQSVALRTFCAVAAMFCIAAAGRIGVLLVSRYRDSQ